MYFLVLSRILRTVVSYDLAFIGSDTQLFQEFSNFAKNIDSSNNIAYFSDISSIQVDSSSPFSLMFDATDTNISHAAIADYATRSFIPLVVIGAGENTDTIFYSDHSVDCEYSSIIPVLNYFRMAKVGLIWSYSNTKMRLYNHLLASNPEAIGQNVFDSISDSELSSLFIKTFKNEGFQSYLFLGDNTLCSQYESVFHKSYLDVKGNLALFLNQCIYQVSNEGSIVLTSPSRVQASSYTEYFLLSVQQYLDVLKIKGLSNFEIYKHHQQVSNECIYSIVNIQNSTKIEVGTVINGLVNITAPILYYGGTYTRVIYPRPRIQISANTGSINPPGIPPDPLNQLFQEGTYFAVDKINRDNILLQNFDFILFDGVNCGATEFDYNFGKACFLAIKDELGIAHIPVTSVVSSFINLLRDLNLTLPFIGATGSNTRLSDKIAFPMFTRVVNSFPHIVDAWGNLVHLFAWKKVSILYNRGLGGPIYTSMVALQQTYGFTIVNDETLRLLPEVFTTEDTLQLDPSLQNIIDIGSNIVFIACVNPSTFLILERFYDLGVRRGDLTFIYFVYNMAEAIYQGNTTKRAELMHGSFYIYTIAWVGDYGESIRNEFLQTYNNSWMRGFYIDATYVAANTASFLLSQGRSYENKTEFITAQRNTRMQGASGIISFDSSSNDRNLYLFGLFNMYQDPITEEWITDQIGMIAPIGTVYFTLVKQPVWPAGSLPLDMKMNYSNCPFRQDQIIASPIGVDIEAGVAIAVLALVIALTIYVFKNITRFQIEMLKVKCIASFQDYLALGFLLVETVQVISIGPTFVTFNTFLSHLSENMSLNLSKAVSFKDQNFWGIFYAMLRVGFAWLAMLGISNLKAHRFLSGIVNRINDIKPKTIPIMSNYLFLPVLVTMLSILACDNAVGSSLTQSYLNYDCNQTCWIGSHIQKVVPASILIVVYVPLAILYRTLWQEDNNDLNIRATSIYLVVKNLVYIILVILEKTIKTSHGLAHGIVFSFIIAGMLGYIVVRKPFNFDRANLWARILICCVLWNSVICTISSNVLSENYVWLILQLLGWLTLVIVGAVLQSRLPPSFVVTIKGRSIVALFRFAFGLIEYEKSSYKLVDEKGENNGDISLDN